jgi:hypothetical protein
MIDVDNQLVAFVHGELDARRTRLVRRRLADAPGLRAEFEALRSADAALRSLLEPPARAPFRRVPGWRGWLAAAALLLTVWLSLNTRGAATAAHNDVVGLTVQPSGGALHAVFTEAGLELLWQNRLPAAAARRLEVLPYHLDDTLEAVGRRVATASDRDQIMPMVISALVHTPAGQRLEARLAAPVATTPQALLPQIEWLRSFEVASDAPPPHLAGRPGSDRWLEEFDWARQNLPDDGPRRLLLDEPGEWTIELQVHSVPPPTPGLWPVFATPLLVVTKLRATGLASDWGPAVDGLQARLVLATGCVDRDHAPLALQLRNIGDRARHYRVVGRNDAPIPQPFHLRLMRQPRGVDAAAEPVGEQRQDLAVTLPSDPPEVRQAPGTVRSLVVCAAYWRADPAQRVLDGLPAGTRLFAEFHFVPSAWSDLDLWQGQLTTGSIELPEAERR